MLKGGELGGGGVVGMQSEAVDRVEMGWHAVSPDTDSIRISRIQMYVY